jgi:hypothetical protein
MRQILATSAMGVYARASFIPWSFVRPLQFSLYLLISTTPMGKVPQR